MTNERKLALAGLVYGAIAIATFGHAAAGAYSRESAEYALCQREPKALCFDDRSVIAGNTGLFAAMMWPLYWSWEAQQ